MSFLPSYRQTLTHAELNRRAEELHGMMRECTLCPRECGARRLEGRYGVCRTADEIVVASSSPHYGEEPPLVGSRGSGTIFFASCNVKCLYCQNYDISHGRYGRRVSAGELARAMLALEASGCHNINLVTPTHVVPGIAEAVAIAADKGLTVPIVYNSGGYESVKTLALLEGIVDIYMPDIKYSGDEYARKYSGAPGYPEASQAAVKEMQRQVGDLAIDERGVATHGLLIRHLVLPNGIAGSREVLGFIAREISLNAYVNIMDQYRPMYRAYRYRELDRPLAVTEYREVIDEAHRLGLNRGFASGSAQ